MRFYGVKIFQSGQNFIFRNSRAPLGKKHSVDMFIVPMRDLMCILGSTYYGLTLLSWTDILHTHIYLIYIKYPVFWNFQLSCSRNRQAGQGVRHPKKSTKKKLSCVTSSTPSAFHWRCTNHCFDISLSKFNV